MFSIQSIKASKGVFKKTRLAVAVKTTFLPQLRDRKKRGGDKAGEREVGTAGLRKECHRDQAKFRDHSKIPSQGVLDLMCLDQGSEGETIMGLTESAAVEGLVQGPVLRV